MLKWGEKTKITETAQEKPMAHYVFNRQTRQQNHYVISADDFSGFCGMADEMEVLRAENAELKRQVAELTGRLAAMEAR